MCIRDSSNSNVSFALGQHVMHAELASAIQTVTSGTLCSELALRMALICNVHSHVSCCVGDIQTAGNGAARR